jgi:hypothetical protein
MPTYAMDGDQLRCTMGLAPSALKVTSQNSAKYNGNKLATIMDGAPNVNIKAFGNCTSPANPAVAAAFGAPQPCTPMCPSPVWAAGANPKTLIEKKPSLMKEQAVTMCAFAGVIKFQ